MEILLFLALLYAFYLIRELRTRLTRSEDQIKGLSLRVAHFETRTDAPLSAVPEGVQPAAMADEPLAVAEKSAPPFPWKISVGPKQEELVDQPISGEAAPVLEPVAESPAAIIETAVPAITAKTDAPSLSERFEHLFGRTLPIWAGGLTLAIAGLLILRYAVDAGFFARIFTPPVQTISGFLFGLLLLGGAEYMWRHADKVRDPRVTQALSGAGISVLYAAILVASTVYGLIGAGVAFALLAALTASALALAMRFGAATALMALIGGLAAPAMLNSAEPNIALLSIYLALTIAGLAGVAKGRAWPWLSLAALAAGLGWGLWLVLAGGALSFLASLSVGGLILMLAVAMPLMAYEGPRSQIVQSAAAIIGALQLAILVGVGGFSLLHWGLFVLIAAASQWLAWRDRALAIVPSISLLLSLALLSPLWDNPDGFHFTLIGGALAAIHAVPLILRLWSEPKGLRPAVELSLVGVAIPILPWAQFPDLSPSAIGGLAMLGALLIAAALWRGWAVENRKGDARFALLSASAAALLTAALALFLPSWMLPMVAALLTAALVLFGHTAQDQRVERAAPLFLLTGFSALLLWLFDQDRLLRMMELQGQFNVQEFLCWASLTATAALMGLHAQAMKISRVGQILGSIFLCGTAATIFAQPWLILVPALCGGALLLATQKWDAQRLLSAVATFAAISLIWAAEPLAQWILNANLSIIGMHTAPLAFEPILARLLLPALIFVAGLWFAWERPGKPRNAVFLASAATLLFIAAHALYRATFAGAIGDEFVQTGLAQRIGWSGLLLSAGMVLAHHGKRLPARIFHSLALLHSLYFSIILHNPLWAQQAVGPWPFINGLLPLYLLTGFIVVRWAAVMDGLALPVERVKQAFLMLMTGLFAWSCLQQIFHGSILSDGSVGSAENILRSILLIALAIGFLLWGIRQKAHDWRIASLLLMIAAVAKVFLFDASGLEGLARIGSFVALGFSLIGIGWLYSRQLGPVKAAEIEAEA